MSRYLSNYYTTTGEILMVLVWTCPIVRLPLRKGPKENTTISLRAGVVRISRGAAIVETNDTSVQKTCFHGRLKALPKN